MSGGFPRILAPNQPKRGRQSRKGAIAILSVFFLAAMMVVLAITIDLGYVTAARSELQRATDAAALAGAGGMIQGSDVARSQAFEYFSRNPLGGTTTYTADNWDQVAAAWLAAHPNDFQLTLGQWDPSRLPGNDPTADDRFYNDASSPPSAIWVKTTRSDIPSFFAKALGIQSFAVTAQAVARYQPRDIALVLDFSGSMSYDSQLRRLTDFGVAARDRVEASLLECYQNLGSPSYGTLTFAPRYISASKTLTSGTKTGPVTVTFRSSDVQVTCGGTISYSKIVLTFSNGATQTFTTSGTSGTFAGTGSNSGKQINSVAVYNSTKSVSLADDYTTIKAALGLTSVAYPYPSGSWDSWIDYVKSSSYVKTAGYRKMYGFVTLINWWLESKASYAATPDLWKVRAQPIATVKDASGTFFDFISRVKTDDRVSFVMYNSAAQTALVENHLTTDFSAVANTIQHRQAGHYDSYTNIGAGIQYGIAELDANGRAGAFKMIVLMTDGNANKPTNESTAYNFAVQQAQVAASKHYPILTICLGEEADATLLQTIADTTNGAAFVITGGSTVTDYGPQLLEVFERIANARPLQIVK